MSGREEQSRAGVRTPPPLVITGSMTDKLRAWGRQVVICRLRRGLREGRREEG